MLKHVIFRSSLLQQASHLRLGIHPQAIAARGNRRYAVREAKQRGIARL